MTLTTTQLSSLSDDDLVKRHENSYERLLSAKDANEEWGGAMGVVTGMLKGGIMAGATAGIGLVAAAAFMPATWGVSDAIILGALKIGLVAAVVAGAYAGGVADPIAHKHELDRARSDYQAVNQEASHRPHLSEEISQSSAAVEVNVAERIAQRRESQAAQNKQARFLGRMSVINNNTP